MFIKKKMPFKRKRSGPRVSRVRALVTSRRTGNYKSYGKAVNAAKRRKTEKRVNTLFRMIETKEGAWRTGTNVALPHNNIYLVLNSGGSVLNPFQSTQGAGDPMDAGNVPNRVGDQISVKGVMLRGFFENALGRSKVFYRVMLLRGAKGETFDRSTIFKGDATNKIIDQVNTERFTIMGQKIFTISNANDAPNTVDAVGVPATATPAGIGTKTFKLWIPGNKFGRDGNIQYENASTTQVKFFDYRVVILAYDWFGTPQDANNVGRINEMYSKIYFKDA